MKTEKAKIIIVGAGPAGIATAVETGAAGIGPVVVLEKQDHLCDTIVSLYHEGKRVDPVYRKVKVDALGILAFDTETREEFLKRMAEVVAEHGVDIRPRLEVLRIIERDDVFQVQTADYKVFEAPVVVVAIGIFGKPVKPPYPLPKEVRDKVHFALSKEPLKDKDILVVGGGDSAAEAACFLSQNNRVTLSYRRAEFFRINEMNLCTLNECCRIDRIKTKMGSDIEALEENGNKVRALFVGGEEASFDAAFYFLGGMTPRTLLEASGVQYRGSKPQFGEHGETNVPRLFLAGDLVADKGTIMAAFNSAVLVKDGILSRYQDLVRGDK